MKQEKVKSPSKASQYDGWVDVHNDELMVELGIRHPEETPRDPSVWTKTPNERRLLKSLRRTCKNTIHFYSKPDRVIPVKTKLIIQLKKNTKFPNTTYSTVCNMSDIDRILLMYSQYNKSTKSNESLVQKYTFNGKTYKPGERPFWP